MTEILYSTIAGDSITSSEATPEDVVVAGKGSIHAETTTPAIYVKTSDVGAEGWESVSGGGGPGGGFEIPPDSENYALSVNGAGDAVVGYPEPQQDVILQSGDALLDEGQAGSVYIKGGIGVDVYGGGDVVITGGYDSPSGSGGAGSIVITGGNDQSGGGGGHVTVQSGPSSVGGGGAGELQLSGGGAVGVGVAAGSVRIEVGYNLSDATMNGNVLVLGIPTTDPGVEGALWNDSGTLMVSLG